jgi:hypothetical protein
MSKSFAVKDVVSDTLVVHTSDNSAKITLDQTAPQDRLIMETDLFNRGVRLQNDPNAVIQLLGGNIFVFCPNGNVITSASRVIDQGNEVSQSLLTVEQVRTLDPAAPVYNELNNTNVGSLNIISRVDIVPDALGTTINSIILDVGQPNVDGREIWIQNLGTAAPQVLVLSHLSGAGTVGGLILGPGLVDFSIPAGGGASIMFDATATIDGLWLIRGR